MLSGALVHELAVIATGENLVTTTAVWVIVAFAWWLALTDAIRRLHVPRPAFVAAPLSWIVARLLIWAVANLLQQVDLPFRL